MGNERVLVAATDRSVVVLQASRRKSLVPLVVRDRFPRSTILGPISGKLWTKLNLPDRTYVHRSFSADIEAADALAVRSAGSEGA
jgi:hypothetical protein